MESQGVPSAPRSWKAPLLATLGCRWERHTVNSGGNLGPLAKEAKERLFDSLKVKLLIPQQTTGSRRGTRKFKAMVQQVLSKCSPQCYYPILNAIQVMKRNMRYYLPLCCHLEIGILVKLT